MAKLCKASRDEREAYLKSEPVYPLFGWINVPHEDGTKVRCAVEDLRGSWSRPNPIYEIMAPPKHMFYGGTHSLLCYSQKDVQVMAEEGIGACDCGSC